MDMSDKYCREKAAQSGSSFYYSFLFLPPEQCQAIMAVYAFCREVDDIVDECTEKEVAAKKLAWWKEELERIFTGTPTHPVGIALKSAKQRFLLQQHLFEEMLQGMHMDLTYQGYQTFDDLKVYCHSVASTAGLLAAEIFGYQDKNTLEYARNLGIAFQLVNIIRDVGEDASRDRIYIPETELAQFSVKTQDIFEKNYTENFQQLMQFQAERARNYHQKALAMLPQKDQHAQRSGIIMAEIYFTLLDEIEAMNYKVLHQRISLTPLRKLWIAWKTARKLRKTG